jgi:hypothetical protein
MKMYLKGTLTVDPSQLTEIVRIKPTKGFARIANIFSLGLVSDQEERETFCAVTILQQIYVVLRSLEIDNIVRLAKDDVVVYQDDHGQPDDLRHALDQFVAKTSPSEARVFETLELSLEHHTDEMVYLIEIWICRRHDVGTPPILITVNGLPNELCDNAAQDELHEKLEGVFESQQAYDTFVDHHKQLFAEFLDRVRHAFQRHMKVDQVLMESEVKIIRPDRRIQRRYEVPSTQRDSLTDPVFYGDSGSQDPFFYAWLWSELCHTNQIHCRDCTIVNEQGDDVRAIGSDGIDAGSDEFFDVNVPLEEAWAADTAVGATGRIGDDSGSDVRHGMAEIDDGSSRNFSMLQTSDPDSGGGWLRGLSDFFGGDGDGGSSCGGDGDGGGSGCGGSGCGGGCGGGD